MTYIEDLSPMTWPPGMQNASASAFWRDELARDHPGLPTRSVGWLGNVVPTTGEIESDVIAALQHYSAWARVEDGFLGCHTCEICHDHSTHGEFWIICESARYVLPQMTLHYVTAHGYRPPDPFLHDLLQKWQSEGVHNEQFPYGPDAWSRKSASVGGRRQV